MNGYAVRKGNRWYAVIYEGLDPVTGKEVRRWHPAGTTKAEAEKLARRLAQDRTGRPTRSTLVELRRLPHPHLAARQTVGAKASTWDGYRRKVHRHILPTLGPSRSDGFAWRTSNSSTKPSCDPPTASRALAPKTVLEIHLIIRAALDDAVLRGVCTRNVALVAKAPRSCGRSSRSNRSPGPPEQLRAFLRAAAGHRLFPALWTSAHTGMRRSELLGLQWGDFDVDAATLSVNRGPSPSPTRSTKRTTCPPAPASAAARPATPDAASTSTPPPSPCSTAWRAWQQTELAAVGVEDPGWMFTDSNRRAPSTPTPSRRPSNGSCDAPRVPIIRLHDLRHTHATLLIDAGVPAKVVSERLGHSTRLVHHRDLPTRPPTHAGRSRHASSRRSSPTPLPPATPGGRPGRSQPRTR